MLETITYCVPLKYFWAVKKKRNGFAYTFCFSETADGATVGINRTNLLLRGCVVRNTPAVVGVVVYAGNSRDLR